MIHRRRLLQLAALAPAASLLPPLVDTARAAPSVGTRVGAGTVVDDVAGLSLSWTGNPHGVAGAVQALVGDTWGEEIPVRADHGHGPDDPSGRLHGPAVLVPGATAYRVTAGGGHDLRVHEIPNRPRRLDALDDAPSVVEPIPGLTIHERSSWTDVARKDTVDCTIGSSVLELGCRSDVGLRHGVVHHTVNSNGYSEADVPGLLFGIQRYHMDTRGWDDIGYNFVIDRFGKIWQAREGDLLEPITGGHTLGLNTESVGVAVLGTFTDSAAPDAVVASLGMLLGWKLGLHGVDPLGHTMVRSSGGDLVETGTTVDVRNISGHRDNQQTSCPGGRLYERLDEVRSRAAELVPVFGHVTPTYTLDHVRLTGWAMRRATEADVVDVEIVVDDGTPLVFRADLEVSGLEDDYPGGGGLHGFDIELPIDLDTRSVVVRVTSDGHTADLMDLTLFATFIDVEPTRFFAPGVYFLRENELTTGTQPGLFEPMDRITRAQMATFLHRFMDLPDPAGAAPFDDLVDDAFYVEAVHWLHGAGITTGTSPTEFSPDEFVTRGQMATFLWRLCGEITPSAASPFDDVPPGAFFATAVAWLAETGITTGVSPTAFAPHGDITRGEMAAFLKRLASTAAAWTEVVPPSSVDVASSQRGD